MTNTILQQMVLAEDWSRRYLNFASFNIIFPFMDGYPTLYSSSASVTFFLGLNNLLMAYEDKSAYALCVFSLALGPNEEPLTFLGKTPVCFLICSMIL